MQHSVPRSVNAWFKPARGTLPNDPSVPQAGILLRLVVVGAMAIHAGCRSRPDFRSDDSWPDYRVLAATIEYPDVDMPTREGLLEIPPPVSPSDRQPPEIWPLTLSDAIQITLANSEVIRDIGGRVVSAPSSVATVYEPAASETDPRWGPEAALAAFDAQFMTSMGWEKKNRVYNNFFFSGGTIARLEDNALFEMEVNKQAATGTVFALRNRTFYGKDNSPHNLFSSAYDTMFEAEVKHPLLQGAGIEFNRIAGPQARPGSYNGVLIARINKDLTLADFEAAVRDLLCSVEQAYWELYFAYHDLDAKIAGRDAALETWRRVERYREVGTTDREQEALAREQYYFLDQQVLDALVGTVGPGGTPAAGGGVYAAERRLRSLMGLPANDGRLIRPTDQPSLAQTRFAWRESLEEALWRRVELRKQKWIIKRRELELTAARNFTRARLDFGGLYRWRGLGDDLLGNEDVPLGSAFGELFDGHHQEWQLGLQLNTPIGNRIGHLAVRHASLMLARERAVYRQQEMKIVDELSTAFAEVERSQEALHILFNRIHAADEQCEENRKKFLGGLTRLEFLLDANIRGMQAEIAYHRALVDANLAVSRVFLARGALLDYYDVYLTEGPWSAQAYQAAARQARKFTPRLLDYVFTVPRPVSWGSYPQQTPLDSQTPPPTHEGADSTPSSGRPEKLPEAIAPGIPVPPPPRPPD
jgi:outer membrane protein TolC